MPNGIANISNNLLTSIAHDVSFFITLKRFFNSKKNYQYIKIYL